MPFSFSFSGEDIDDEQKPNTAPASPAPAQVPSSGSVPASAFPVAGKPLLPATSHGLERMLAELPSKVAYGILDVNLNGEGHVRLPRRELWDVRVQLMAEDESGGELEPGLGNHDVRTGIYEGGFKSWESSVDLVKILSQSKTILSANDHNTRLGCGTALPSLALFQWALDSRTGETDTWLSFVLADYNPTVLQLVTLPNFILSWALHQQPHSPVLKDAFSSEGEVDFSPEVLDAFVEFLSSRKITLHFFSGGWSPEFVDLVTSADATRTEAGSKQTTVIVGAETIYSPFALDAFTQTLFALMREEKARGNPSEALVGAKKLYFGVGGSLDDFVAKANDLGADTEQVWEETEGPAYEARNPCRPPTCGPRCFPFFGFVFITPSEDIASLDAQFSFGEKRRLKMFDVLDASYAHDSARVIPNELIWSRTQVRQRMGYTLPGRPSRATPENRKMQP
ncbi:hypothetical protein DL767_006398 [Monosporascus sp. MG133]|nr:hypothetical protein DL767_006398 [Monosporascus sp. MG133]